MGGMVWSGTFSQATPVSLRHDSREDFARAIAEGAALQQQLPELGLVAVGGMAASLHAGHRLSVDVDHTSSLLAEDFLEAAARIRTVPGWRTTRTEGEALILGEMHGIRMGVRQLRRRAPLETTEVGGLRIPTAVETLRIKAHLLALRRRLFDYVDVAALIGLLGPDRAVQALAPLTQLYHAPSDAERTPIARFLEAASSPPRDQAALALGTYRGIQAPYNDWDTVRRAVRQVAHRVCEMEIAGLTPAASFEGGVNPPPDRAPARL